MAKGRKTGGRTAGTPNKSSGALQKIAQPYTPEAVDVIVGIMREGESEQVRLAAARELLDRGHGKAPQAVTGPDGEAITVPGTLTFLISQALGAENRT